MDTQPLGPFLGVNNRLADFELHVQDKGDYLRQAINVDIDNAGQLRRRRAMSLVQAMTGAHSVFETGSRRYFVRDSVLYSFVPSPYSETLLKVLGSNVRMDYVEHNGDIYCSNGTDALRIAPDDSVTPWGMATPAQPTVTAIAGTVPKGWYQVALTYVNSITGEESGCAGSTNVELTASGALRVTIPGATPGATHVNVYVSQTNGDIPGLYATVAVGTSTVDITSLTTSRTLQTDYQEPLPAGSRVFVHMGRLCSVSGNYVYYSDPYRMGYYKPAEGYIPFEKPVTVAVPNQFGVYIAADKTRWFAGSLHAPDAIQDVLPYGAVPGTEFVLPHNSKVGWFGEKGVVIADPQGQAEAVMSDNIDLMPPASGCSVVLADGGFRRVVSCDWCVNVETGAASQYSGYDLTSASGSYATRADGLYQLVGSAPYSEQIQATISLGKQAFGSEALKRLPAVYLGVASEMPMEVRVQAPNSVDYTYTARSSSTDLSIHRVDIGKGVRTNWLELTIYNVDGSDFTMASASFAPTASTRRI